MNEKDSTAELQLFNQLFSITKKLYLRYVGKSKKKVKQQIDFYPLYNEIYRMIYDINYKVNTTVFRYVKNSKAKPTMT
jgi:hypothetical protein